jgi:hypothetical protein
MSIWDRRCFRLSHGSILQPILQLSHCSTSNVNVLLPFSDQDDIGCSFSIFLLDFSLMLGNGSQLTCNSFPELFVLAHG